MIPASTSFSVSGASSSSSSGSFSPSSPCVSPSSPTCVSPSSPVFASSSSARPLSLRLPPSRRRLPPYSSPPPPAYHRKPALAITVTRTTFDSLSSASSCGSVNELLTRSLEPSTDLDERQHAREQETRARLTPLLFPKPRGVKSVVKAVLGSKKHARDTSPAVELDDYEREVAEKMYIEYVRRCEHFGF